MGGTDRAPHTLVTSQGATHFHESDHYRTVFESTIDGLVVHALDGTIIDVNPAYYEMFGYGQDELVGRHVSGLAHSSEHPAIADRLRELNGEQPGAPIRRATVVRKDGSVFYTESRSRVFQDGRQQRILTVVRDVTERAEAERQVAEREEQYRSIFEASVDAIVIGDLDGRIVEASPAASQMWGYTGDEIIGKGADALLAPESLPVVLETMDTIRRGERVYGGTGVAIHKDGMRFYVEGPSVPFTFRGRPHIMTVVRDITERVKAYELLERRVEERTRELSTLLDVSRNVASTLELRPLLDLILDTRSMFYKSTRSTPQ